MKGFALSSEVEEFSLYSETASALLVGLRRLEALWSLKRNGLLWTAEAGDFDPPAGYAAIHVVRRFTDAATKDDLAYHTVTDAGDPVCFISYEACGGEQDTLIAVSHELFEAAVDPTCTKSVPLPGSGNRTSLEVCDWVQGRDWEVMPGVLIAEAVGPAFFGLEQGTLSVGISGRNIAPFWLAPRGYHDVITPAGESSLIYGERVSGARRALLDRVGVRGGLRNQ